MGSKSIEEEFRVRVIPRIWKDPLFRKRLISHTKIALEEMGIEAPDDLELGVGAFQLPPSPVESPKITDYEYAQIAIANVYTTLHDLNCNGPE